jgi:hypothetical protein
MARIVAVHGIGQQNKGENRLHADWLPDLRDGIKRANGEPIEDRDLVCAFYGDLFRPPGKALDFPYGPEHVTSDWERELLLNLWVEAAQHDPAVPPPGVAGKARTPALVQGALRSLSRSKFFVGLTERVMIRDLKQVYTYIHDDSVRAAAQERVRTAIAGDTSVLIAHSLGTVVAYEVLSAREDLPVRAFVTLGSPLGIRNLIFDRLRPSPTKGVGVWPAGLRQWVNVSDAGDIVALIKTLRPLFGGELDDHTVHNGSTAHNVGPYLSAVQTGRAIVAGLAPTG